MKTTFSHLPENKQHEILRIADIIKEVLNPDLIILFGSYAKGTYVEDRYKGKDGIVYEYVSDYDFLVVVKQIPEKLYVLESTILDRVDRYKPPVNLEVHELAYINKGLEEGEYFFVDIINEGVSLDNKGEFKFSEPRALTATERKEKAQRYFDTWYPQAQVFFKNAKFDFQEGHLKIGAFELHQATESLYYAALLVFTDYKPKTHNLRKLRIKTKAYSKELFQVFRTETDKDEEYLFELLKKGYIDARYRTDYSISKEELSRLIDKVGVMISIVQEICEARISALN